MRSSVLAIAVVCTSLVLGTGCAARETPRPAPLAAMTVAPAPLAPVARPASTKGSRGSPAVGRFVRERNAQLQFCYDEARVNHTELSGTVTVAVTLGDAGEVLGSDIVRRSWSGDGDAVERCVLATVRRWRFPVLEDEEDRQHSFAVIFSGSSSEQAQREE
jgi:TonB family protein